MNIKERLNRLERRIHENFPPQVDVKAYWSETAEMIRLMYASIGPVPPEELARWPFNGEPLPPGLPPDWQPFNGIDQ